MSKKKKKRTVQQEQPKTEAHLKENETSVKEVIKEAEKMVEDENDENVFIDRRGKQKISVIAFQDFLTKKTYKISGPGMTVYALYSIKLQVSLIVLFFLFFNVRIRMIYACLISIGIYVLAMVAFRFLYLYHQPVIVGEEKVKSNQNVLARIGTRMEEVASEQPYSRIIKMLLLAGVFFALIYDRMSRIPEGSTAYYLYMVCVYLMIFIIAIEISLLGRKIGSKLWKMRGRGKE